MDAFEEFIESLSKRLNAPLPGISSQLKMASIHRQIVDGKMVIPEDVRKAAVLVLFYPSGGKIHLVFMKRTEYPGVHSGQISFPGGGQEPGDTDMADTALRETEEEIGIKKESITTIGILTDMYIPPSNFLVTPVIGFTNERPVFHPDPEEVDEVVEVALEKILDKNTKQEKEITIFPDIKIKVPSYYTNGHVIWGATAMMLSELVEIITPGS
jgi:8-oxo-dGTP pyrophosphatase MutT (NUDIX family)